MVSKCIRKSEMIKDYSKDFGPFENTIWLNCAHQGPLPKVAVAQAKEAIAWKIAPYKMTTERFSQVPQNLRRALGKLIEALPEDIILGNSASYGLHLLANGIRWKSGDEIVLVEGDFPSDILPWLGLRNNGVNVRFIKPRRYVSTSAGKQPAVKAHGCSKARTASPGNYHPNGASARNCLPRSNPRRRSRHARHCASVQLPQ